MLGVITVLITYSQKGKQTSSPKIVCRKAEISPNPLRQGQSGTLSFTVSNEGDAPYRGILMCDWVNLKTGMIAPLPQAKFFGVLYPGESRTLVHHSNPIISPESSYHMRVLDGERKAFPNCSSPTFKVISTGTVPDLRVESLGLPSKIYPGDKLSFEVKVRNQGKWRSSNCKGRLYWDINPHFSEGAHPIENSESWPEIAPLATSKLTLTKTLPLDLPNGPLYFFYCIDWDREVNEADEFNNCLSLFRTVAYRLEIIQSLGYVPYPNTPRGSSVATDIYLKNSSYVTFKGTLAVSLYNPQDSFLLDLATWSDLIIGPTGAYPFTTGIKTSPPLNLPIAENYKVRARYKSSRSNTFSTLVTGECGGCLNPFRINIVAPKAPFLMYPVPSKGHRGEMKMGL